MQATTAFDNPELISDSELISCYKFYSIQCPSVAEQHRMQEQ